MAICGLTSESEESNQNANTPFYKHFDSYAVKMGKLLLQPMQKLLLYVNTKPQELLLGELKEMLRILCTAFSMLQFARVAVQGAGESKDMRITFSRLKDFKSSPVDEAAREFEELLEAIMKEEEEQQEEKV